MTPTTKAKRFKGHSGIEFPAPLVALGFEDESWQNDACARATLRFMPDAEDGVYRYPVIFCWCDYANPKERELGSMGAPRYFAFVARTQEEFDENNGLQLYSGESAEECAAAIKAHVDAWREFWSVDAHLQRCKDELVKLVLDQDIPAAVISLADVHAYIDGNGLGGTFEPGAPDPTGSIDNYNTVFERLDDWIRAGELMRAVLAKEAVDKAAQTP